MQKACKSDRNGPTSRVSLAPKCGRLELRMSTKTQKIGIMGMKDEEKRGRDLEENKLY
jgi:hypothetical protein